MLAKQKLHVGFSALALLIVSAIPASASTSATATYAATLNPDSTYTYQLLLKNTGTTSLKTFWFSWIPYASFLPSVPTSLSSPANWSGQIDEDYYGNSILWDTTGAGLAPGASLTGFSFTTPDSPDVLAGLDDYYDAYPVTYAYVYSGSVTTPNDPLPPQFGLLTAVPGAVPEPATATLLLTAGAVSLATRRRRA
ncbi:MAG TPA: PEP-CTERM sorting domain-containing protein [Tepidisphaeraceae bacterium]|jgi:hypothetical protein|nr:PEP-CTERM sorting domain-containing protein [Tepidisphaeraceae bacterium]